MDQIGLDKHDKAMKKMTWPWKIWRGLEKHAFDKHGLDKHGLDKHVLDKHGLDKQGLDKHGLFINDMVLTNMICFWLGLNLILNISTVRAPL